MLRPVVHGALHVLVPGIAARVGWRAHWLRAWTILVLTNLVDLDHLLADPVFDPRRCSIAFHPLHSWPALAVWALLACWKPSRLVGVGLVIHMVLDLLDCAFTNG